MTASQHYVPDSFAFESSSATRSISEHLSSRSWLNSCRERLMSSEEIAEHYSKSIISKIDAPGKPF